MQVTPGVLHCLPISFLALFLLTALGCGGSAPGDAAAAGESANSGAAASTGLTFQEVASLDQIRGKTPPSPFDSITKPDIPFEMKTNDLPESVVGFLPMTFLGGSGLPQSRAAVFDHGRYISVPSQGEGSTLLNLEAKQLLPVPFDILGEGVSVDSKFVVSTKGLHRTDHLRRDAYADPVLSFFEHPQLRSVESSVPYDAVFSPDGKYLAIGFGGATATMAICLVDLHQQKVVQLIETGCFPARFTDDGRLFRCFSEDGSVMTYQREGSGSYRGVSRSAQIFPFEAGGAGFTKTSAFGPNYLVTITLNVPDGEVLPDGQFVISVYRIQEDNFVPAAQMIYNATLDEPIVARGSRFAVAGYTPTDIPGELERWLFYGDADTKQIGYQQVSHDMMFEGLDVSGRYAYFSGHRKGKQLAILRLAKP